MQLSALVPHRTCRLLFSLPLFVVRSSCLESTSQMFAPSLLFQQGIKCICTIRIVQTSKAVSGIASTCTWRLEQLPTKNLILVSTDSDICSLQEADDDARLLLLLLEAALAASCRILDVLLACSSVASILVSLTLGTSAESSPLSPTTKSFCWLL